MKRIAIIGAGLSGLVLSYKLAPHAQITVFEKSRGSGGRLSTRRVEDFQFNHGAPDLTPRTAHFKSFLEGLERKGIIQDWKPKLAPMLDETSEATSALSWPEKHLRGTPGMSAIGRHLAGTQNVKFKIEVAPLQYQDDSWKLYSTEDKELGQFDIVISTAPAPQTINLFPPDFLHTDKLHTVQYSSQFVLMVCYDGMLETGWQVKQTNNSPMIWVNCDLNQDSLSPKSCVVAHASPEWSAEHFDIERQTVKKELNRTLERLLPSDLPAVHYLGLHRWRYSQCTRNIDENCFFDQESGLGCCGDFFKNTGAEGAFESAEALAQQVESFIKS